MAMTRRPIRRQRPVKGGRQALPSCVLREIHQAVNFSARKFNVSRSWVVATALADFFGISLERYDEADEQERPRLRRVK